MGLRHRIARALARATKDFLSGEDLARTLGVSRAAVAKHVAALREQGFPIEAVPRRGYRLRAWPDRLTAEAVQPLLRTESLGWHYQHLPECESTNAVATQAGLEGAPSGTTVTAEVQTAGRGRRGRTWHSPPGAGIYASVLLRPPLAPPRAPPLTLVAAVAAAEAVAAASRLEPRIKWPNDLLLNGKKVVGILLELNAEPEQVHFVVVGLGVNVHVPDGLLPPEIRDVATSLDAACTASARAASDPAAPSGPQPPVSRPRLLAELLWQLETWTDRYLTEGFAPIRQAWRARAALLGAEVVVNGPTSTWTGIAQDVDDTGALLVTQPDGQVNAVLAGDVSLRPAQSVDHSPRDAPILPP